MRFKKGDRVRVVDDFAIKAFGPRNGDEGTVTENSCAPYVKWDKGFGGDWAISEDSLELVPSATAASTFKVGDRVREASGSDLDLSRHWAEFWAEPGDAKVTEFYVTGVHKRSVSYSATKGGSGPMVEAEFLELVDWDYDPRKLKIEAGKFYKTRDGRKVGPMLKYLDDSFMIKFGDGNVWLPDGKAGRFNRDKCDLIAEWPTIHACAAAQVDNLRDEYGPVVKAGTKAGNDNAAEGPFVFKDGKMFIDAAKFIVTSATPSVTTTPAIVCLIENGQPKPSTYPHVHPSRGHAGDEAARLARKYPGKEFGVYELVDTRQIAKPTYAHEWQRLAAGGNLFSAANALTKLSGIDYDTAFKTAKAIRLAA